MAVQPGEALTTDRVLILCATILASITVLVLGAWIAVPIALGILYIIVGPAERLLTLGISSVVEYQTLKLQHQQWMERKKVEVFEDVLRRESREIGAEDSRVRLPSGVLRVPEVEWIAE